MVKETELYELLGVDCDATAAEIRKAYRKAALKVHPDRAGGDTVAFQKLQEAYATLFDVEKRRIYDEFGAEGMDEWNSSGSSKPTISKEDIEQFVRTYRFGPMEEEDVKALLARLKGNVTKVLQYIPYSDGKDLKRFVAMWDQLLLDENNYSDRVKRELKKARKTLLKRAGRFKARQADDFSLHEEGVEDGDGVDVGDTTDSAKNNNKDGGDMGALIAQFAAGRAKRKADFNNMVANLEDKYCSEKKKGSRGGESSSRKRNKSKKTRAKGTPSSSAKSGPRQGRVVKKRS